MNGLFLQPSSSWLQRLPYFCHFFLVCRIQNVILIHFYASIRNADMIKDAFNPIQIKNLKLNKHDTSVKAPSSIVQIC